MEKELKTEDKIVKELNSIFEIRVINEEGECAIFAGNKITSNKTFKTIKSAEREINKKPWYLIMILVHMMIELRLNKQAYAEKEKEEQKG